MTCHGNFRARSILEIRDHSYCSLILPRIFSRLSGQIPMKKTGQIPMKKTFSNQSQGRVGVRIEIVVA
jgi:hypothetical protein